MLAAVFLSFVSPRPADVLQSALTDSATALKSVPAFTCAYTIEGRDSEDIERRAEFKRWKSGTHGRFEVKSNEELLMKAVFNDSELYMIDPLNKRYFKVEISAGGRPESTDPEPTPVEENTFDWSFNDLMKLKLAANPEFKVEGESLVEIEKEMFRRITFSAARTDGKARLTGQADFEKESSILRSVDIHIAGERTNHIRIRRTEFTTEMPDPSVFFAKAEEYEGFQKQGDR